MSFISSVLCFGSLLGSLIISPIILRKGRRFSILIGNFCGIIGCILMNFICLELMILGRLIIGITIGIYDTCIGLYAKEYVPYSIIGKCASVYELNYSLGIFLSYFMGLNLHTIEELEINPDNNWWRFMVSFPIIFLVLSNYLFLFHFKYETPFFLFVYKKDFETSEKALHEIYISKSEIKKVLSDYKSLLDSQKSNLQFKDMFTRKYFKRFFICLILLFTQQACGIDGFLMYSNNLFIESTSNEKMATLLTNLMGLFLVISGITTILIIEKLGRRLILIIGQIFMILLLLLLSFFYYIKDYRPVIYLIIGYIYINGVSLSPISFIYAADVLPEVALGFGLGVNNFVSYILLQFFMHLYTSSFGGHGLMITFCLFIFLNLLVCVFFLKETKDLSADEIDKMYTPIKEDLLIEN